MFAKTWLPRVIDAVDVADVDVCAAGDPAAVITLETSADASAVVFEDVLADPDALADPVVCATGTSPGVAGVGGAVRRMKAANSSISFW